MRSGIAILALFAFAGNAQAEEASRLELVCFGGGTSVKSTYSSVGGVGADGQYRSAGVVGQRASGYSDQLNLWIEGDVGSIRMPPSILPGLKGGNDGWYEVRDIKMTDAQIDAKIAVNFINKPRLHLDRYTGMISVNGQAGSFMGKCEKYEPAKLEKKF